ncbi:universal stress protein [Amnibacterium kyonggiense]|uniref:Nucleotide-binding universal stress UspA family protein n=1 Tax=Amnibacterium kyonggiense TaxID=595671 RepID=A0A4R7FKH7_9MICO|nr:universal stress protein [Amnibacterium kyonggiense]TDS76848.1 nucleotide-binding universal stress UspA family protein [Amnibacterium kyonggiense]
MTGRSAAPAANAAPPPATAERVLLVAGGDAAAFAAARWVARRAQQHPIAVTLVAVPDDEHVDPVERTATVLRGAAPHLPLTVRMPRGPIRSVLSGVASRQDLVVLGTNRVTAMTHVLPPTLAVRLAESVRRPVVLVPRGWQDDGGDVVVGVVDDGSDGDAIDFAVQEASATGRCLRLAHVWRLSAVVTPVFPAAIDAAPIRDEHRRLLDRVADRVRAAAPALEVSTTLVHGEPNVDVVRSGVGASLVVVGSHEYSAVDRVLLRSVGRALAERPPCPVAIVPPRRTRS